MLHKNAECASYLRMLSVESSTVTYSPGPMMVYALTLNVTAVLGGKFVSEWFVSDVLVQINNSMRLEQTSYWIITPFASNGDFHDSVKFVNVAFTLRSNTSPGTYKLMIVEVHKFILSIFYSKFAYTHHLAVSSLWVLDHYCMVQYLHHWLLPLAQSSQWMESVQSMHSWSPLL